MTARFDIWPVLEHYDWQLPAPRGVWQTVKCAAHDDHHQSCRVSSDAGRVKCLACGFAGDAIDVVRHYEGIGYRDAVRRCEAIIGSGDSPVSGTARNSRTVLGGSRNQQKRRAYVPPRLRGRTDDRA